MTPTEIAALFGRHPARSDAEAEQMYRLYAVLIESMRQGLDPRRVVQVACTAHDHHTSSQRRTA